MDAKKMREEFEVSMQGMTFSVDLSRGNHGCYTSLRTHELYCSWVASWQASREAVVVELPKVVGFEGAYDSHRHHEFVPSMSDVEDADEIFGLCRRVEAKEAIEAQGLKVAP